METGTVESYSPEHGLGLIRRDGGDHVLVNRKDIEMEGYRNPFLIAGLRVSFNAVNGPKGPEAKNVKVTSAPPGSSWYPPDDPRYLP